MQNGISRKNSYAVIDLINCINPHDTQKNTTREHYQIKGWENEYNVWLQYCRKIKIPYLTVNMAGEWTKKMWGGIRKINYTAT